VLRPAERHPEHTAPGTEAGGLDEELAHDVGPGGAECLAEANLADPFGDGHQHDVHHPDATDEQGHAGDPGEEQGERCAGRIEGVQDLLLGGGEEVACEGSVMPWVWRAAGR